MNEVCDNTDREIWRRTPGDFYSPSIHVTDGGAIGMEVGGYVIVASPESWHAFCKISEAADDLEAWLSKNTGTNDDWPIEIKGDKDGAEQLAELLTKLKTALEPLRK